MSGVSPTTPTRPRRQRRFAKRVTLAVLALIALAGVGFWLSLPREIPLAAPFSDAAVAQVIVAAAPPGWQLVRTDQDQLPRGQHWNDDYRKHWHGGEELTLTGPTKVAVSDTSRDLKAVESLEVWILPSTYPDGTMYMDLFGCQMAEQIFQDRRVAIYALTSRYDGMNNIDNMSCDLYSETSTLQHAKSGLAISWTSYKSDIARALQHAR